MFWSSVREAAEKDGQSIVQLLRRPGEDFHASSPIVQSGLQDNCIIVSSQNGGFFYAVRIYSDDEFASSLLQWKT